MKLGIQRFWRMDRVRNLPNFEELEVVMQVRLDRSGKMMGAAEVVSPASPPASDDRWRIAIQAARIALERAARDGFDLPAESYGRWQVIEVTFNPAGGVSF